MAEKKKREDGRRPLLVYLRPDVIRALKRKALDEDTHVYLLLEDILLQQKSLKLAAEEDEQGR